MYNFGRSRRSLSHSRRSTSGSLHDYLINDRPPRCAFGRLLFDGRGGQLRWHGLRAEPMRATAEYIQHAIDYIIARREDQWHAIVDWGHSRSRPSGAMD